MPTSREAFGLTAAYIESLHDEGISVTWPGVEPVASYDCLDLNLLESAARQPFGGLASGHEFYPSLQDKASCLFFSIAADHIFSNGNKRTAVLALDQFLMANGIYLLLTNEEIKKLAQNTASYRTRNENHKNVMLDISQVIAENSIPFVAARHLGDEALYRSLQRSKWSIRKHPLNTHHARPRQAILRRIPAGR